MNFRELDDNSVIDYMVQNFHKFGIESPEPNDVERWRRDIKSEKIVVEKGEHKFALIVPEGRKSPLPFVVIAPESRLLFIMVTKPGFGLGSEFLSEIKRKYAKNHRMTLSCVGDMRKKFFEKAGFYECKINQNDEYSMAFDPIG